MKIANITLKISGNSIVARLVKKLVHSSGLGDNHRVTAEKGKITIRKIVNPRSKWPNQINSLVASYGDLTQEFSDMNMASNDGLDALPWDGPHYNNYRKVNK